MQLEVLALVCANLCDVRTMCAALCTSKSARQCILDTCSGALELHIQSKAQGLAPSTAEKAAALQRVIRQAAWLAQHGSLIGQLQLHFNKPPAAALVELADADELAVQMAMPSLLQVHSMRICASRPAALLSCLCASSLDSLHLQDTSNCQCAASPLLAAAVSRLVSLRQFSITGQWYTAHDSLPAVLAGLPQLTKLQLQPQLPAAALQGLPSQLVELQLADPDCEAAQLVAHVGALQQLQSLTLVYSFRPGSHLVASHAAAWANVKRLRQLDLEMYDPADAAEDDSLRLSPDVAAGIAAATQLTHLYAWFSGGSSGEVDPLRMLLSLQQLRTLEFQIPGYAGYGEDEPLASFGTLFSSSLLQLQNLTVNLGPLRQLAVSQIALQATQVTQLILHDADIDVEGLHTIAHSMQQLRRLCLCDCGVGADEVAAAVRPPLLPALEQLAFVCCERLVTAEEQSVAKDIVTQARAVAVIAAASRRVVPHGFVGAYTYPP
jgi:hypothetical protein